MTKSQPATTVEGSLGRDVLYAARYYLGNRWTLVALASIAIGIGLASGGWGWIVAAGLAPVLIATLPCLIMCGFGICMVCRSGEKSSAPVRNTAETASPPTTLAVSATDNPGTGMNSSSNTSDSIEAAAPSQFIESDPPAAVAGCCQSSTGEINPEQTIDLQPNRERKDSHA